ncbi:MAG: glycosyltransferase family 2 protein [Paludibacteraceae bacterium]|nr:glycosyltransferase family 2 protein [Paludibacteraceae bacterium]
MIKTSDIAILLATYNGEKYLSEQINSLIAQTYQNWQLFIHDDGSTDDTLTILHKYEKKDSRIHILSYPPSGGACKNFMSLLDQIDAPYYMFCDQDDVWLPDKIEKEMHLMKKSEQQGSNKPIIVHSDLHVVDSLLQTICPSFWQYEQIILERYQHWEDFAHGCLSTGCTMLFNSSVKEITLPTSNRTLMHDEWVTLCTVAHDGIVVALQEPTILYRQHNDNALGAQNAIHRHSVSNLCSHIGQILRTNVAHYKQMNAIRPISVVTYIKQKLS